MPCSYSEAEAEIFTAINTSWSSGTTAIVGYIPTIKWPDVDLGSHPDLSKFYLEPWIETISNNQSTLTHFVGNSPKIRYTCVGIVNCIIYAPKGLLESSTKLKLLSQLVQNSIQKGTTNVIIKNCKITKLFPTDGISKYGVFAQFEFDSIN